jgi:hypothetical protein
MVAGSLIHPIARYSFAILGYMTAVASSKNRRHMQRGRSLFHIIIANSENGCESNNIYILYYIMRYD